MLKNLTQEQFNRFKRAVEYHCIRKDRFCDGKAVREKLKDTTPCPYFFKGVCTNPNILNAKNEIIDEIERSKKK